MSAPRIFLVALALALAGDVARADLPPPKGITRVDYLFQIDAVPDGQAAIAFPGYDPGSGGRVIPLEANKDVGSYQGYRPGLYVLSPADAAALKGKDDDAIQKLLDERARRCLRQIPRVVEVPDAARITKMTDIIHLDVTASGCEARLVRTLYEGPAGERGEGGIDASGKRTPPAPFGPVPDVTESGFVLAAAATTPASPPAPATPPTSTKETVAAPPAPPAKSAAEPPAKSGCSAHPDGDRPASLALLVLASLALGRRRR